jgi:hypothetical protein
MELESSNSGVTEAVVVIKAAPQVGQKHGETVCCAGIDLYGRWLRLYPVSFRDLQASQKFARWDKIRFGWRKPNDDQRIESRRVDQQSIEIVGELKLSERQRFLEKSIVTGLNAERETGKSLALLRARIYAFSFERKSQSEIDLENQKFDNIRRQADLFSKQSTPYRPCPYKFKYRYSTDDGDRVGTCQDWEIEATFFKWSELYGEEKALFEMQKRFGEEYPQKGMLFAMGTHSLYPDTWLINGIVRLDTSQQAAFL